MNEQGRRRKEEGFRKKMRKKELGLIQFGEEEGTRNIDILFFRFSFYNF